MKAGSEAAFQQQVTNLATYYGWRWFHAPDNLPRQTRSGRVRVQNVQPGFPDLVLLRGPELIFAELKTDKGRLSIAQSAWINELQSLSDLLCHDLEQLDHDTPATVDVYIWRPADFDELHARLARGRTQQKAAAA